MTMSEVLELGWCPKPGCQCERIHVPADGVASFRPPPALETREPTHRCKDCGALWFQADIGTWHLRSETCGKCCDNVPMGMQLETLPTPAQPMGAAPARESVFMPPGGLALVANTLLDDFRAHLAAAIKAKEEAEHGAEHERMSRFAEIGGLQLAIDRIEAERDAAKERVVTLARALNRIQVSLTIDRDPNYARDLALRTLKDAGVEVWT